MAPHSTSSSPVGGRPCNQIAILLIDDDPAFRKGLAGLFRDDGHELLDFEHPGMIPPYAALGHVGLVVTDYELPGKNGFELADSFHAACPEVPIVVITGFHTDFVEAEAARRGFVHLLFKPVDYDRVHELIHRLAR